MVRVKIGGCTIERRNDYVSMPYIIAEAGVNHEGDIEKAKLMIEQAAQAGANAIKFQSYKAERLASRCSPAYWDTTREPTPSQYELFKKYDAFWKKEFELLARCADEYNIDFLSTPFDYEAVDFLYDLVPAYKIASADITNYPLLKYVASKGKPILLSTGASTISEIYRALEVISEANSRVQVVLLHCVLEYPTPLDSANLGMILHMRQVFPNHIIGYSDHTLPEYSKDLLIAAWLLGAQVIEKHFTFDKSLAGNDHYHAFDRRDLEDFVKRVRAIRRGLGQFYKEYTDGEKASRLHARRSLVASRFIKRGTVIKPEDITIKRPGTGIPPKFIDLVIDGVALQDISEDEILQFNAVQFSSKSS